MGCNLSWASFSWGHNLGVCSLSAGASLLHAMEWVPHQALAGEVSSFHSLWGARVMVPVRGVTVLQQVERNALLGMLSECPAHEIECWASRNVGAQCTSGAQKPSPTWTVG